MARVSRCVCAWVIALALSVFAMPLAPAAQANEQDVAKDADVACSCVPSDENCYIHDELLVQVAVDGHDPQAAQKEAELIEHKVDEVCSESILEEDESGEDLLQVELDPNKYDSLEQAEQDIAHIPGVVAVQPNYRYFSMPDLSETHTSSGEVSWLYTDLALNDSYLDKQYYLGSFASSFGMNAKGAWSKSKSSGKVTVAVFDTGFYLEHEDLKSNLLSSYAWDASKDSKLTGTNVGKTAHGTHVAGIVAAGANNAKGVAGVSYNAKILPVKVFDDSGECTTADLIRAYNHVLNLVKSKTITNLHVINMSLGDYEADDQMLEQKINTACDTYKIVTVCAGGNGDAENDSSDEARTDRIFPADFDKCVSVTALDTDGTNAAYSDYNRYKDISAPGNRIFSTHVGYYYSWWPYSDYEYLSGTSMAAPAVSGAFALLWAKYPNLTVSKAKEAIYNTATPIVRRNADPRIGKTGSRGCVDAGAALDYLNGLSSLSKATVTVANVNYTGKARKPEPVVKLYGRTLRENVDYVVSYKNNVKPGKASLTVKGMGGYTGSVTKTFSILVPAKVEKVINSKVKGLKFKLKKGRRLVVSHKKVAYASGYKTAYRLKGTKTWYVGKTKKLSWTSSKLKKKGTYQVRVRAYVVYKNHMLWGKWSTTHNVRVR